MLTKYRMKMHTSKLTGPVRYHPDSPQAYILANSWVMPGVETRAMARRSKQQKKQGKKQNNTRKLDNLKWWTNKR